MCCYLTTLITGSFIIIPLFFMCCGWWKKIVFPAFEINFNVYESLAQVIKSAPNLKSMSITVIDNCFDTAKSKCLYDAISMSRLNGLSFINLATQVNYNSNEYNNFADNMRPIKALPNLVSDIRWGN